MEIGLIIALISLILSLLTIYLTQFRPSQISVVLDPEIQIHHADYNLGVSTGVYIPTTFINTSSRTGVVLETRISVYKKTSDDHRHLLRWREFQKVAENGWQTEQEANSIAVKGKSAESKVIWYMWFADSQPELSFTEGTYNLDVYVWLNKSKKPMKQSCSFYISKADETAFQDRIKTSSRATRRIVIDKELDRNRVLTKHETIKLLESN